MNAEDDILYHRSCKFHRLNSSKSVARKQDADIANDREEARKQKKRSCSTGQLKLLPYKNKCILCNNPVSLYLNNSSLARKTYSRPDNKSADDLKKRLLETAEKRIRIDPEDTWAIQVKGRLISMNGLVAKEALLHKRCNLNFSRGSSFNTDGAGCRKQNDFRLELFDELCTWLETKLEHSLFTLEQIHQKMISMDKSPDKSLVYLKKHLRNMLVDRYQEKTYFTSQGRRTDILCLKDMSASIIREYHNNTEDDDKTKIINTAVKLIKKDISLLEINRSVYPSMTEMIDPDRQPELVPESVKLDN